MCKVYHVHVCKNDVMRPITFANNIICIYTNKQQKYMNSYTLNALSFYSYKSTMGRANDQWDRRECLDRICLSLHEKR